MEGKYSVQAIGPDDLADWWQLRLKSLHDHPDAFGSDFETSQQAGPKYAERGYFKDGTSQLFAAFTAEGGLVAQAATFAESGKRSHIAHVVSVYTNPDHRGNGLASRLVQVCIDHLQSFGNITSIRISVNAENAAALHTYRKLGFEAWGDEPDAIRAADGSCHNELHMVLTSGARRS